MYAIAVTRIVLVIASAATACVVSAIISVTASVVTARTVSRPLVSAAIAIAVITVAEMIAIFRKEATMCRTLIYAHVIFST